jgi:hypothetical protein
MLGRPKSAAARVHEQLGGSVVEEVGLAGLDEAQLVGDRRGVRQHVADPGAAGAVLLELLVVTEEVHAVARAHEREPLAFDEAGRDGLAVEFVELRLVVEKLQLAGAAGHEQVDDALGFGLVMRRLGRERIGRRSGLILREQRGKGDRPEADTAIAEEVATRYGRAGGEGQSR